MHHCHPAAVPSGWSPRAGTAHWGPWHNDCLRASIPKILLWRCWVKDEAAASGIVNGARHHPFGTVPPSCNTAVIAPWNRIKGSTLPSPTAVVGLNSAGIHQREVLEELVESLEAEEGELKTGQPSGGAPLQKQFLAGSLQSSSEGLKSLFSWIAMAKGMYKGHVLKEYSRTPCPHTPCGDRGSSHKKRGAGVLQGIPVLGAHIGTLPSAERILVPKVDRAKDICSFLEDPDMDPGGAEEKSGFSWEVCPLCGRRRQVLYSSGNSWLPSLGSGRNFPLGKTGTGPWQIFAFLCSINHAMLRFSPRALLARLLPTAHAPWRWAASCPLQHLLPSLAALSLASFGPFWPGACCPCASNLVVGSFPKFQGWLPWVASCPRWHWAWPLSGLLRVHVALFLPTALHLQGNTYALDLPGCLPAPSTSSLPFLGCIQVL